jgi:Asp/Glu/hydantoin racemase
MPAPIYVINPNSLRNVTESIARAAQPFAIPGVLDFKCVTMDAGPPGIVSQRDSDRAAPLVADFVSALGADDLREASGFIVACYSDPGLFAARETTALPVLGIGEASLHAAARQGKRTGVIAISSKGIARHWRMYRMLGLAAQIVGERAIDLSVADSGDETLALTRLIDTGRSLRDVDGADVLVLGCAGMADLRSKVEDALSMPVIDPCGAAAAEMIEHLTGR